METWIAEMESPVRIQNSIPQLDYPSASPRIIYPVINSRHILRTNPPNLLLFFPAASVLKEVQFEVLWQFGREKKNHTKKSSL